ncbi:MAG: transglycosylase domain-containing protein, partial [Dehalococcoidia bacterium]|nr:transglycosylase domain-containing protein [Dehalococcoidia bacterium]
MDGKSQLGAGEVMIRLHTLRTISIVVLALVAIGVLGLIGLYVSIAIDFTPPQQLIAASSSNSRVFDRNGKLLYEYVDPLGGLREPVPLKVMSPNLIAATIATEDPSFYDNPGVNLNGLLAAVRSNLPQ